MTDSKEAIYLAQISALTKQVETLVNQNQQLQNQLQTLNEILINLNKEKFGSKSEQTKLPNQLSIFNEVEFEFTSSFEEPISEITSKGIKSRNKAVREDILKNIQKKTTQYLIPDEDLVCDFCNSGLKFLGYTKVRTNVEYIPAKLIAHEIQQASYECPCCKKTSHPFIKKATVPSSFMPHSLATASTVAEVIEQKYINSVPLYRQEAIWEELGVKLSRSTMANWVIYGAENYLLPIEEKLKERLLRRDVIHVDETPVQVLKEPGKKPETKSYMWVYRSGNDSRKPIVLYDYKPTRSGEIPKEFLKGFKGYLHTDGYAGYNKVEGVTRCGCWAHLRRKFVEADIATNGTNGYAKQGIAYCDRLFHIEEQIKGLKPDEVKRIRQEEEIPILEEFWRFVDIGLSDTLPQSKIGKAFAYAINQKPYMGNYLKDGRCSISNNAAENAIRPFTVGRKNWLFCDSQKGANASSVIYSIVETAKANGLNVGKYLEYIFTYMPDLDWRNHPELLDDFMPWAPEIQKQFKK